jgi:nucleoside-diphosphate-sugar epimerase
MRILVTGANGFVGLHLCERLLSEGHEVYGLVRNPKKVKITDQNLHLIAGDLQDAKCIWQIDLPETLDVVIHTAGLVHSFREQDFFDVNSRGTENLINTLKKKYTTNLKFILISSLAAAGPSRRGEKKLISDEDHPVSAYGMSKKAAENYLLNHHAKNWTTIIIRPPMVIGPRDTAVLDIFKMVRDGVVILPDLNAKKKEYSFVCVFDLVETITRSLNCDENILLYSSHPQVITFHELILTIQKEMKKDRIVYLPLPAPVTKIASQLLNIAHKIRPHQLRLTPDKIKELMPASWICDETKTTILLGQEFKFTLVETIHMTYLDYKKSSLL